MWARALCNHAAVFPTSTPEQLEALGALWAEHPECLMQTHLSEQTDEIAWVRELFPNARDYLDTYETFGLLGERGLYGHAIHLNRARWTDWPRLAHLLYIAPLKHLYRLWLA